MEASQQHQESLLKQAGESPISSAETQSKPADDEMADSWAMSLEALEGIIGYRFNDKRLLEQAYTHTSYDKCFSYEVLEYVGDSVLGLAFTREQFAAYPNSEPGVLTPHRAANVDSEKLARASIKHGLHRFLRHSKNNLEEQIQAFSKEIKKYPIRSCGFVNVPKVLSDIVESTIGAVFIDCNCFEIASKVCMRLLDPIISLKEVRRHPMTQLCEICQKMNMVITFEDKYWKETGEYKIYIDEVEAGRGSNPAKKDLAKFQATKQALEYYIPNILKEREAALMAQENGSSSSSSSSPPSSSSSVSGDECVCSE